MFSIKIEYLQMLNKESLIKYIRENNDSYKNQSFENCSIESLVILKVQIELSIHRKKMIIGNIKIDKTN